MSKEIRNGKIVDGYGTTRLMADAEKPIQSYSHSIDKDNKIR